MRRITKYFPKAIFTSAIGLLILGLVIMPAGAFTLSPSSGSIANGGTINVLADAPTATPGVSVYLQLVGLEATGFTDGAAGLTLGDCAGSAKFTTSEVCFSFSSTAGDLTVGQIVGSFTVNRTGTSSGTITAVAGSEYGGGEPVTGDLGTYTWTSGGGTLPNTSMNVSTQHILLLGLLMVTLGLLYYPVREFLILSIPTFLAVKRSRYTDGVIKDMTSKE